MIKDKMHRLAFKLNVLELARHHRKFCEGENCTISLILLMQLAEETGITFTEKEKEIFI